MQRLNRYYLLVVFGLLLLAPFLNDRFHFVRFDRANENRKFNDSLTLAISKLDKFPKDCELYLQDNFAFRTPLITWARSVKTNLFSVSPDPDRLIIGKRGRYFVAGDERLIYEGDEQWTERQLDTLEGEWLRRKRYFDEKGIKAYFVIAPTALEAYPEDLPINVVRRFRQSRREQVASRFRKRLPELIVDAMPAFKKAKTEHNLYLRLDNHWNKRAGMVLTEMLLKRLQREGFSQLDASYLRTFRWKTEKSDYGYLQTLLARKDMYELVPVAVNTHEQAPEAPKYGFPPPPDFMYASDYEFHYKNPKPKNKLKLLIVRDSFGDAVYPFLKEAFAETVVIFDSWQYKVNKPIVEAYHPDVVIFITYDPHMENYLNPKYWE